MPLSPSAAAQLLEAGRGRLILVAGDLMLDEWIMGEATRISPEAPVPVVRFQKRRIAPGGAANVATNLLSLGARVEVSGLCGHDDAGCDLLELLAQQGAGTGAVTREDSRPTTLKTRVVAGRQQMLRIDREHTGAPPADLAARLSESLRPLLLQTALLCLSDYDKGLAECGVFDALMHAAREAGVPVVAGPKPRNLMRFSGAGLISFNQKEASEAAGFALEEDKAVERAGHELREKSQARALVITRGGRGAALFEANQAPRHIAAHEVEVFDVAGAGDTFLAAVALALAGGADVMQAAELGNLAAAASVRHAGVVAVSPAEVLRVAGEE